MSKKNEEKRWELDIDYTFSDEKLQDVKGSRLTPELVEELMKRPPPPPRPTYFSPEEFKNSLMGTVQPVDDLQILERENSRAHEHFTDAISKLTNIVEQQSDDIDSLKIELKEIKALLNSTLKIARKGVGF